MPNVGEWARPKCPVCGGSVQYQQWHVRKREDTEGSEINELVEGWRCVTSDGHELPPDFDPNADLTSQ